MISEPMDQAEGMRFSRRRLLHVAAVASGSLMAGAVLAACSGAAPTPTTAPVAAATPTTAAAATAAPTTAAATPTTAAAASPTAAATAAAAGSPTAAATAAAAGSPTAAASPAAGTTPAAGTPTATPQAAAQPQSGGTAPTPRNQTVILDQSLFNVFDSFNAFIPNGQTYQAGFQQVCKEFLFYANFAQGKVEPWLATGWKYNTDFTQLTLTLNPNAKWNDGQAVTSADLKFSIDMLKNNATLLTGGTIRQFVTDTSTPDNQTCVIKLNAANPRFHYVFICGIVNGFEIVPQHVWSKVDPTTWKDNPPTRTGPYKLMQVIPAQFMFVWQKNPDYWNKANLDPKPQYVVYRSAPVMDSDANEFKRAQTDEGSLDYPHMQALQQSGYKNMIVETAFRDPCPRGMWINSDASKGVLAEPKFRWALSYLLDRKTIGQNVWLIPTPPAQYPWADYKSNSQWQNTEIANSNQLTYDPTKAASLLDSIGATKGSDGNRTYQGKPISIEIMTPALVGNPEYVIGQMVADELKKLGIPNVSVRYYQNPVWTQKWNTGDFDISSHWLCGVAFDPNQLYNTFETQWYVPIGQTAVSGNNIRLKDENLNKYATQLDTKDPTAADTKSIMDQALSAYYAALPAIPIIQTTYPRVFNTTYWTGWPTDDNLYHVPLNWWGQYLFVIGKLQPTGAT